MKRYLNLSLYRLFATISIFIFHFIFVFISVDAVLPSLISSAVAGFSCLSGFIHSNIEIRDFPSFMKKKVKNLILPALLAIAFMAFGVFVYSLFSGEITQYFQNWCGERAFNGSLLVSFGGFWYIPLIFVCYLVTPILEMCISYNPKLRPVIIVLASLEIIISIFVGNSLVFVPYAFGYIVGYIRFDLDTELKDENIFYSLFFHNPNDSSSL